MRFKSISEPRARMRMHHFGVSQLILRSSSMRPSARLCASWRHYRRLFSKAFWEHSTTRNQKVWMRRARTSCYGFSFRQLRHTCTKPIVSDTGAVDAAVMRQSCCVDRKLRARKRACAWRGALDKRFAFLEEQIAWLNALSLDAVQGNGKLLGYINLLVRRFVAEPRQRLSWLEKLPIFVR